MTREEAINEIKSWDFLEGKEIEAIHTLIPELKESEDERVRKVIYKLMLGMRKEIFTSQDEIVTKEKVLAYLEKQKEPVVDKEGMYYYLGGKFIYCGYPATEGNLKKQDIDFSTNDTSKNDARKRRQIIALLSASKGKCMASFAKDIDECIAYLIEKQKEQEHICDSTQFEEGFKTGLEIGLRKQKDQKPVENPFDANETMKMKDRIDEGFTKMMMQEQKPVEYLDKDKIYAIMTKLTNLSYSTLIPINSDEFKKLHEITSEVRSLLDYPIEQKPAEWSEEDNIGWDEALACVARTEITAKNEEELQNAVTAEKWLKEIKFKYYVYPVKQEWSEEDEMIRNAILGFLNPDKGGTKYSSNAELVEWSNWLKSLRPQPKQEWSEADETYLQYALWCVEKAEKSCKDGEDKGACWSAKRWLKSLHPQSKPEWCEEDLEHIKSIIHRTEVYGGNCLYGRAKEDLEWLKNLLNRFLIQPKPAWSEEDEKDIAHIIRILDDCYAYGKHDLSKTDHENLIGTLRSLRPHWKPSEEQMDALLWCTAHLGGADHRVLAELYEHLKMYCL